MEELVEIEYVLVEKDLLETYAKVSWHPYSKKFEHTFIVLQLSNVETQMTVTDEELARMADAHVIIHGLE